MKDSGVEWIGKVPKDWSTTKLNEIATVMSGETRPNGGDFPLYGANGPIGDSALCNVREGDTLIGRVGSSGEVFIVPQEGFATDNCLIVRPLSHPIWVSKVLATADIKSLVNTNTVPLLVGSKLKKLKLPMPPHKETSKILAFLSSFTNSLPNPKPLIEAREAFKQSIIWHVITGKYEVLDNGKLRKRKADEMKDSGVGWIGAIPQKWIIRKVKESNIELVAGLAVSSKTFTKSGGTPLIRIRDIDSLSTVTNTSLSLTDVEEQYIVQNGDYLLGMDGNFNIHKWKGNTGILNQRVLKITLHEKQTWQLHTLQTFLRTLEETKHSTTVIHIKKDDVSESQIAVPPSEEENEKINSFVGQFTQLSFLEKFTKEPNILQETIN